jgi:hypothetical protein
LGVAGASWTLLDLVVVGQYIEFWVTRSRSATLDYLVGFCEITALAMIWLVFFPPTIYQRWIERSDPHQKVTEG